MPRSLPWRMPWVGSWLSQNTCSICWNVTSAGSKMIRTTSAWPVRPVHTSSYAGFGVTPPA